MGNSSKKSIQLGSRQQLTIDIDPKVKQIDFNSKEIREELDKLKEKNQLVLEAAMVDTQKLSIHFTV